jgi:hypothetical protein
MIMKYGLDGDGQSAGLVDKHDAGSALDAFGARSARARVAAPTTLAPSKRPPARPLVPLMKLMVGFLS